MFFGEFSHTVDDKGRVLLPARFRKELGERFVVTIGAGRSLMVLAMDDFEALCRQLADHPLGTDESTHFSRLFASSAEECEPDKQGRILLPQHLRQHAAIVKNLVFAGVITRVEIWEEDAWGQYKSGQLPQVDMTLDNLRLRLPMAGGAGQASTQPQAETSGANTQPGEQSE